MANIETRLLSIRVFELICLIIAVILVAVAAGRCVYIRRHDGTYFCEEDWSGRRLTIEDWDGQYYDFKKVQGQYFVFVSTLVLIALTIFTVVKAAMTSWGQGKSAGTAIASLGFVICVVCGALQVWYGVGFETLLFGSLGGFVKSWIAAAAFYFLAAALYLVDLSTVRAIN